jgi:hypothetical protein
MHCSNKALISDSDNGSGALVGLGDSAAALVTPIDFLRLLINIYDTLAQNGKNQRNLIYNNHGNYIYQEASGILL